MIRPRARIIRAVLPPAVLGIALLAYAVAALPLGTEVTEGHDGTFGINIAGGPFPNVQFHRPATLDISSIQQRRPAVRMSLGVRSATPQPLPVTVVAELPIHARVTEVVVRQAGGPTHRHQVPPDGAAIPAADGTPLVREFRALSGERGSVLLLRIPVLAAPAGTVVEIAGTVDGSRFTSRGRPVGLHYVHIAFGHGTFVEVPSIWDLPSPPDYRGPNLLASVDIGRYRLSQATAVPDPARTRATVVTWSEPRTIAGIDVAMTAEDTTRTSIMSWLGAVLSLVLGAWAGVTADRLLGHRRSQQAP